MSSLPENQLKQAQALLLDIRSFMAQQTAGHQPFQDYRMVDVFRGLELANRGLDALIREEHYSEYLELREAFRKGWTDLEIPDDLLGEK